MSEKRFCLRTDDSGHHYVIPVELRDKWSEWDDILCSAGWVAAANYAEDNGFEPEDYRIDGPHLLTFEKPYEE